MSHVFVYKSDTVLYKTMSIIFRKDGVELLLLRPLEFRRVYTMDTEDGVNRMKYSHSDVIVEIENGNRAMLEIIQGLLPEGSYIVRCRETAFDFTLSSGKESMAYLKRLIFMTFPDLTTKDMYCGTDLIVG